MGRTVSVKLLADVGQFTRGIGGDAVKSVRSLSGELDKAAKGGRLDSVADSAAGLGLGLVGMAGYAVKASMDFDKSMSAVKAATHGSTAQMDLLRKAALQAGQDTQYSATGAADAITELSKAGVSTADILNGGLNGALSLAAAGQLEVGEAAETAASAMTQFKLKGNDIPHVADLLAAAAGKAQGSVHDMGQALNQAGLVASQTGLSIEETTGGLAAFASAGLIGSDAGTSFKQMLLMLQAPSDKSKALMDELGISLYDSSGQFVGLTKFAGQLQTALKDLTPEARAAAMAQIFGADATRAASVMYEQGATGVQTWIDKVNDAGYAQETAALLTDNLAGDIERLKGSIETLAIQAGGASSGGLRTLVKMLESLVDGIAGLPPVVTNSATVLAGVGGAAALLAAGWVKSRHATAAFRTELESIGPSGERASRGLQKVTSAAGKATLIFAGLQAAGAIINKFQSDLNPQVDALAIGLEKYASGGELAGEASRLLGGDLEDLKVGFDFLADGDNNRRAAVKHLQDGLEGLVPGLDGTNTSLTKTRERITAMDTALAQLASSGNTASAAAVFDKLAQELATGGVSMAEFRRQFPQYAAALEVAGKETTDAAGKTDELGKSLEGAADKQEEFKTSTDAAAAASKGQREALSQLSDFMKAEADPVFGLISAQEKLAAAQKAASKAVKEHGRNSSEAKGATRDLALAAIDLQGAVGALGGSFNGKMTPALRETFKAAGVTDSQMRILDKQFQAAKKSADAYDGKYEAKTSAPGAKQSKKELDDAYTAANGFAGPYRAELSTPGSKKAQTDINNLWNRLKDYDGGWTAAIKTTGYGKVAADLRHLLAAQRALSENMTVNEANRELGRFFATGGPVIGPGTATSDSIVARLSAGEHVLTAAEVIALGGQGAVMQLRRAVMSGKKVEIGDETPGFAKGGPVHMLPFPTDVSQTKIPEDRWSVPSGGRTSDWIVAVVRAAFPGMQVLSKDRPGATTLSGNTSYHARGRAVDFPASKPLAEWVNAKYFARTKELITPWNELNIHNGKRHTYTGAVYRQHNFAGGNAHDHWAMANGGVIREPVFGYGASGRTYSFGERGAETVTPGIHRGGDTIMHVNLIAQLAAGANPAEHGRQIAQYLERHFANGGQIRVNGQMLVGAT